MQWFEFAEKTRNKDNLEEDFKSYAKDEIFSKMMKRLNKSELGQEDYSYLRYYYEWESIKDSVAKQFKKEGLKEEEKSG